MHILEEAILSQQFEEVKQILAADPSCIHQEDKNGICMTFLAAKTGNEQIVRYIAEYSRANMNVTDKDNRNILHYAAMSGNTELVKYLVEKVGMSPVQGDFNLITPFDIAHEKCFTEMEAYFEQVAGTKLKDMYRNPIRTGMYPDPSIVRVEEDYYMVNSSFIFFPCIPISHSKDLIHWKIIGHAITNPEWANINELQGGRGYWAPDISYYEGRFYITATYRLNDTGTIYRKQIVVSSERAEGPYSQPSVIEEDGIDPSIFNDTDGKRYMLLNRGARIFELDKEAAKQISKAELLYYGDHKWGSEGPHLLKKDGYYYLFEAEGGTGMGHRITVSRSETLKGNYEPCPYNPIMIQQDKQAGIQRCGHGKPVQTQNGEWYMIYLCGRTLKEGYGILGRETAIDPIIWTADGWPIVNSLRGPSVIQKKPDLPEYIWENNAYDEFEGESLGFDWMFSRVPEQDGYFLENSFLNIKGSESDLDSMYARNVILRRQQDFKFSAECKMKIPKLKPGQNAGMTCFYDEDTFLKFGVFKDAETKVLEAGVFEHIGDSNRQSFQCGIEEGFEYIYLKVITDYLKREFYIGYESDHYQWLGCLDNVYYLSDEGYNNPKRFTGAMIGMYAFAGQDQEGNRRELTVEFDYFHYDILS